MNDLATIRKFLALPRMGASAYYPSEGEKTARAAWRNIKLAARGDDLNMTLGITGPVRLEHIGPVGWESCEVDVDAACRAAQAEQA